jgi:tetratricopeptide (TPR) repeat protein
MSLNNLGNRLSELGRREEALQAAEEAVEIRRGLAETRPDALLPDLAGSLNNLGNRLSELGRREEALQAAEEAVVALLPFFQAFPTTYAMWMTTMARNYVRFADEAGREPDESLLEPIAAAFEDLEDGADQ